MFELASDTQIPTVGKIIVLLGIPIWLLALRLAVWGGSAPHVNRDRCLLLAVGDIAAFIAFGILGLISHEKSFDVEPVVRSIAPFVVAWLAIAPFFGVFSAEVVSGRKGLAEIALVWLPVGVIALCARALVFDRELFNAFFVIALVGNGIFLLGWRAVYSRLLAPAALQT